MKQIACIAICLLTALHGKAQYSGGGEAYYLANGETVAVKRSGGEFTLTLPGPLPDSDATVVVLELDRPVSTIE